MANINPSSYAHESADKELVRLLVFPKQFSLGKLYSYEPIDAHRLFLESHEVSHGLGHYVGEAKGVISLPVQRHTRIYLSPSYELIEHPEVLTTLDPKIVDCVAFDNKALMIPVDKAVEPLSHLTGLRRVEINVAELTDEQAAPLRKLTNLESLSLVGNALHGSCLTGFTSMTKLKSLDLTFNPLTRSAFTYISRISSLERVAINQCGVNDSDLAELAKLHNLTHLGINQSSVTAKGLALLKHFKNLQHLSLLGTSLSVKDLTILSGSNLRSIDLPHRKYSEQDLQMLKEALPSIHVAIPNRSHKVDNDTRMIFAPLH
jgi:Leucine-rich repeat (LRR) protein